jgi:CubicO group peptidase (beta-lactamase class C family)
MRFALLSLFVLLSTCVGFAADRPTTGKKVEAYAAVDKVILDFLDAIDAQAATVAISRKSEILYSRGYGYQDAAKKKPTAPDALLRIASISKPITHVMVLKAIDEKLIAKDTKFYEYLDIKPHGGKLGDDRIKSITINQLLQHTGGWDREKSEDPMFNVKKFEKEMKLKSPATARNVVEYMLAQPLDFEPGEKTVYSNFGYCILGRVLEKAYKKPYAEVLTKLITKPHKLADIRVGVASSKKRDPREVNYPIADDSYPLDVMDAHGGLVASAPALCAYLNIYWLGGEERKADQKARYTFFGSLPGTTALVLQRNDGTNVAVLINGRRDASLETDNEALKKNIERALDEKK